MLIFTQVTSPPESEDATEADLEFYGREYTALSMLRPLFDALSSDHIRVCLQGFATALGALHFAFLVLDRSEPDLPATWVAEDVAGWWQPLTPELNTLLSTSRSAAPSTPVAHTWFRVRHPAGVDADFTDLRLHGVHRGLLVPAEPLAPCDTAGCIMLAFADGNESVAIGSDLQFPASIAHAASLGLDAYLRLHHRAQQPKVRLSGRESECLRWASIGKTSWETACILGVSERTINFHLGNTFAKLNVNNKQAAVAQAILQDLI